MEMRKAAENLANVHCGKYLKLVVISSLLVLSQTIVSEVVLGRGA